MIVDAKRIERSPLFGPEGRALVVLRLIPVLGMSHCVSELLSSDSDSTPITVKSPSDIILHQSMDILEHNTIYHEP